MFGLTSIVLATGLALAGPAFAQDTTTAPAPVSATAAEGATDASATPAATPADPTLNADGTQKVAPVAGIGQPSPGAIGLQDQVTKNGLTAHGFHNSILLWLCIIISVFVLLLLLWVIVRFRRSANPVPSRTSHNTMLEVVWTLVPVLILVVVAVPSIRLLAAQFKPAPDGAVTLKAIGNQWYWSYEYPDNGGIQITANMLKEKDQVEPGERYRTDVDGPRLLATDNRIVLPVGVPIRLLTTSQDVIHAWAMPAFWIKLDAVPGRINETSFTIEKPGVYFGQCSELCGARHGFMPIAVEAVSQAEFAQWVAAKGGTMPSKAAPSGAAPAQPGNDAADDTATPENGTEPVVNATDAAATNTGQ